MSRHLRGDDGNVSQPVNFPDKRCSDVPAKLGSLISLRYLPLLQLLVDEIQVQYFSNYYGVSIMYDRYIMLYKFHQMSLFFSS